MTSVEAKLSVVVLLSELWWILVCLRCVRSVSGSRSLQKLNTDSVSSMNRLVIVRIVKGDRSITRRPVFDYFVVTLSRLKVFVTVSIQVLASSSLCCVARCLFRFVSTLVMTGNTGKM